MGSRAYPTLYPTVKSAGTSITIYSHDWTDKTSWYHDSVRVVDEVATPKVPAVYTVYEVAHDYLIDTYHGSIPGEDYLKDSSGNSYRVVVKVNDVAKTEQDPHVGSGGDYTVDYAAGEVTFLSALAAEDVVKVTYHYENGSTFVVKPAAGKNLSIDYAEVQFSSDIILTDTTLFQPYGLADVFAPQYVPTPFPSGTLIPLQDPVVYKGLRDYHADATKSYPACLALGGTGWRGLNTEIRVFHWEYLRAKPLIGAYGMEVRVSLQHHVPFTGTYCSATFYTTVEDA